MILLWFCFKSVAEGLVGKDQDGISHPSTIKGATGQCVYVASEIVCVTSKPKQNGRTGQMDYVQLILTCSLNPTHHNKQAEKSLKHMDIM